MKNLNLFLNYDNESLYHYLLGPVFELIFQAWPWYIVAPAIGILIIIPLFLAFNKWFN